MDVAARLAIGELLSRSAYALDERDVELLASTFASDVELVIAIAGVAEDARFAGHAAVMQLMTDSMAAQQDKRRHVISNLFIMAHTADSADVISNLTLLSVADGAARLVSTGLYRDHVVLQDGQWRIGRRRIELDLPY